MPSNVRVLTSGQTVRLTSSQPTNAHVATPISTTILRQQPNVSTATIASSAGTVIAGSTATATTIGGKQILLQKPISLSGQNVLQLVKTSQGMAVQSLPKVNVVRPGTSIQQQISSGAQIVTANAGQQGKTALIGTNVVKLMSPTNVGGNKILMKNSNLVQVGKVGAANAGKPAFVITNKQGQPIRTNQQIIFVTTASGIRGVQTGSIVTSSTSNFVSIVSSPQINTITSSTASGANSIGTPTGTVKMIRNVNQQGKPITLTLPVGAQGNKTGSSQLISMPQKGLTFGGKAVTLQLASGNQKTVTIVSSAGGGTVQKTINAADLQASGHKLVMMPSKRVITHNTIQTATVSGATANIVDGSIIDDSIEQMDGAFDMNVDSNSSDDEYMMKSVEIKRKTTRSMKLKNRSRIEKSYRKSNVELTKKHLPKFVKMGLFGGSPPTETSETIKKEADNGSEIIEPKTEFEASRDDGSSQEGDAAIATSSDEIEARKTDADNELAESAHPDEGFIKTEADVGPSNSEDDEQPVTRTSISSVRGSGPTPSETEAANILTTIKSGDLLRNNEIKTESSNTLGSPPGDNVKILYNSDPSPTIKSNVGLKNVQSNSAVTTYSATGDLDALASAALQASTGKNLSI